MASSKTSNGSSSKPDDFECVLQYFGTELLYTKGPKAGNPKTGAAKLVACKAVYQKYFQERFKNSYFEPLPTHSPTCFAVIKGQGKDAIEAGADRTSKARMKLPRLVFG